MAKIISKLNGQVIAGYYELWLLFLDQKSIYCVNDITYNLDRFVKAEQFHGDLWPLEDEKKERFKVSGKIRVNNRGGGFDQYYGKFCPKLTFTHN